MRLWITVLTTPRQKVLSWGPFKFFKLILLPSSKQTDLQRRAASAPYASLQSAINPGLCSCGAFLLRYLRNTEYSIFNPARQNARTGYRCHIGNSHLRPFTVCRALLKHHVLRQCRKTKSKNMIAHAAAFVRQLLQYPPASRRTTRISKLPSSAISFLSRSNAGLAYSMIAPQRKHARWQWSRLVLAS